jgi:galactitol-specific phosphotransferase system IIC component
MDRCSPRVATRGVNMRIITFGRTVVVPLSLVVLALAGLSAPPVASRSTLVLVALVAFVAIGLIVLVLTKWRHASRRLRPLAQTDDVVQVAKDDASDLARMGSDAG